MGFLKLVVYCVFCEILATTLISTNSYNEGYYWRDFTGDIPYDAVPGGTDKTGEKNYIGQTVHTNCALIPGQIEASRRELLYHYDAKGHSAIRNVKILCSPHPEQFEWIKTNVLDIRFLTQKHLVPGGFDADYPLLIGRASVDDQIVVGKVTVYHKYQRFAYAMVGKAGYQDNSYEVLSYVPRCLTNNTDNNSNNNSSDDPSLLSLIFQNN